MNYVSSSILVVGYRDGKRITFMRYIAELSEYYSDSTSTAMLFVTNIKPHPFTR